MASGIAGFVIGGLFVLWLQVVGLALTGLGHVLGSLLDGGGSRRARPKAEHRVPSSALDRDVSTCVALPAQLQLVDRGATQPGVVEVAS